MSDNSMWAPLYIMPMPLHPTAEETAAAHKYASEHLHELPTPENDHSCWSYFTADPTDRSAQVYSIAKPGTGGSNTRFGNVAYVVGLYIDHAAYCTEHENTARAMVDFCTAHENYDRANEYKQEARKFRSLAESYRAAAQRIRDGLTK